MFSHTSAVITSLLNAVCVSFFLCHSLSLESTAVWNNVAELFLFKALGCVEIWVLCAFALTGCCWVCFVTLSMQLCSCQNGMCISVVNSLYSSPPGSRHPFLQRVQLDAAQALLVFLLFSLLLSFCLFVLLRLMLFREDLENDHPVV